MIVNHQKDWFFSLVICCMDFLRLSGIRIRMENNSARTPPNLFGIARKIAYAKRKYHSGWMCVGVERGLAGVKFSGSIKEKGYSLLISRIKKKIIIALTKSFLE